MIASPIDPGLAKLYAYWHSKAGCSTFPSRKEIDPVEIPLPLWPSIVTLAVVPDGSGIRYKYGRVGGQGVSALGRDPTGRFLDEVYRHREQYCDYLHALFRDVLASRCPMYTENRFEPTFDSPAILAKRIILPLADNGRDIDRLMVGLVWSGSQNEPLKDCLADNESVRYWLPAGDAAIGEATCQPPPSAL